MTKYVRTEEMCKSLCDQGFEYILARFLDPKNVAKGDHSSIEPMMLNRFIQTEALELSQAYRNNEGFERELEECGDIALEVFYRIDQIIKKHLRGENL